MAVSEKSKSLNHTDQVECLQAEVAALRRQLRHTQRLASVGTMAAMVAHEFNNILTPVISYAQLAGDNPALMKKAVAKAAAGGERASIICQAILGMTGTEPAAPEQVNIADLVAETLTAMARDPRCDQIELVIEAPADLAITARRVELQQVLLNLILNARTAVLAKSGRRHIEVSAQSFSNSVVICVSDTGVGIAPENLGRVFQPFFTTNTSPPNDHGRGSGLGLAICREIVSEMGGEIYVDSTPGRGTTFAVNLPQQAS